jgi:hypothetical protein
MAGRQASESTIEAIRKEWGFNDPLPQQYITTMKKVFTGDLESQFTQLPVGEEILKGLPRTLSLAIGAAGGMIDDGDACFAAYAEAHPLSDGWEDRVLLHQIAPLVVHAVKFGGGYVASAERAIVTYA